MKKARNYIIEHKFFLNKKVNSSKSYNSHVISYCPLAQTHTHTHTQVAPHIPSVCKTYNHSVDGADISKTTQPGAYIDYV